LSYGCARAPAAIQRDFEVEVFNKSIAVRFWPTGSLHTFARFTSAREIAEFGPVSTGPVIQHGSPSGSTRNYNAAEVLAMNRRAQPDRRTSVTC
jgi:hypothetical protein